MTLTPYRPEFATASTGSLSGMLITGFPEREYHARPEVSKHDRDNLMECPEIYKYRKSHPKPQTKPMQEGTAWGVMLCQRERFDEFVAVTPETYPAPAKHERVKKGEIQEGDPLPWNANAGYCSDWIAANDTGSRIVLSSKRASEMWAARAKVYANPLIAPFLANPVADEISLFWTCPETGVPRRGRIDRVAPRNVLIEIKKAACANSKWFGKQCDDLDYWDQGAEYMDAWEIITGEPARLFWIACEVDEPPYMNAIYECAGPGVDVGRAGRKEALLLWKKAMETGIFPGYQTQLEVLLPGKWKAREAGVEI